MSPFTNDERFNHLYRVISSPRFLQMQGLGNEVPFFICPFPPEETVAMAEMVRRLTKKLQTEEGLRILTIDLYDLSIELLQQRGIFEQILEMEPEMDKEELLELLQNVLDPEDHLAPAIVQRTEQTPFDVLFLTGIGEVFPYIRSHTLLNNLQAPLAQRPMVMFFPGEYTHSLQTGASLDLFGRLHDDQYYRAFDIFQVAP